MEKRSEERLRVELVSLLQDEQVRLVAQTPMEVKRWQEEERPQPDAERLLLVARRQLADAAHQRVEERPPVDASLQSAVQRQSEEKQLAAADQLSAVQLQRDAAQLAAELLSAAHQHAAERQPAAASHLLAAAAQHAAELHAAVHLLAAAELHAAELLSAEELLAAERLAYSA